MRGGERVRVGRVSGVSGTRGGESECEGENECEKVSE